MVPGIHAFKLQMLYQGVVTPGSTHKGVWRVDAREGAEAMAGLLRAA
jgi:hypothetical protein